MAPVVYYSTDPNVDLSTRPDLSSWSTSLPTNPASVTAFVVDCTKDVNGDDFILKEDESLIVYVNMQAPMWEEMNLPDGLTLDAEGMEHQHAYNNSNIDCDFYRNSVLISDESGYGFRSAYTKIGIKPYELKLEKVWDDENRDGLRADSVTLRLWRNGVVTDTTVTLDESSDWKGEIAHLPKFDAAGQWIEYAFTEEPVEHYELTGIVPQYADGRVTYVVTNRHEPERISIPFTKSWQGDEDNAYGTRPITVTARLLANGVFTGNTQTIRANADGSWQTGLFADVYKNENGVPI